MSTAQHILIIDDEPDIRELVKDVLEDEGYQVSLAANAAEAHRHVNNASCDLALLDIWMPGEDGISLLRSWVTQKSLGFPVLIMSGHGTVETAVEAVQLGAAGFIEKPLNTAKILQAVDDVLNNQKTKIEALRHQYDFMLAGNSLPMKALRQQINALLNTPYKALAISAESGSGQAVLAYHLHTAGKSSGQAFKMVLASALNTPQDLDDALATVGGGSLFIDVLEESTPSLYAALSGKLAQQETCIMVGTRMGFDDIGYRPAGKVLTAIPRLAQLRIPPLHERPTDVLDIIDACLDYQVHHRHLPYRKFPTAVKNHLLNQHWLNNVESLNSLIEQLLLSGQGDVGLDEVKTMLAQSAAGSHDWFNQLLEKPMRVARREFEYAYLKNLLSGLHGNVGLLAERSGMERTHLYRKLKSLGIKLKK